MPLSTRLLLVVGAVLASVLAIPSASHAHSGIQSYVYVSITDSSIDGRVEYPMNDLGDVLGIEFPSDPAAAEEAAVANADAIQSYTAEHLAMSDTDGRWDLSFEATPSILPVVGGYVIVPFSVERSFDGAPRDFRVRYDGIIHAEPERDALFLIENDWGTARFDNEADHLTGFSVGMTTQSIELENVGVLESMEAVRGFGTEVVRAAADHLLFVVALLLSPALLTPGGSLRGRAPTLAAATRRATASLLVFLATSSFSLWVFGSATIEWSPDLVGSLVAGSLLVAAAYAVWQFTRRELLVVGVLGAVQGIGFASAYVGRRLDRIDTPLALLSFNLGVLIAVLVVGVLVFPPLLLLRRTALAGVALYGGAGGISLFALAWLVDHLGNVDVERLANPLTVWPRNLWLILLGWAVAGAMYAWTAHRDALRPIETESEPAPSEDRSMVTT